MFRADLHCHTLYSDGACAPDELIAMAHREGIQALSFTDHDTVEAYEHLSRTDTVSGIKLVCGVEFSAWYKNCSVHILGYGIQVDHPTIHTLSNRHISRREVRLDAILKLLRAHKIEITREEVGIHHRVGRPHVALAMLKKGYVSTLEEGFQNYLAEDKPCYVQGEMIDVETTLNAIHEAKGYAILAHPHLIKESLIPQLLKFPFDGIETYYGKSFYHNQQRWLKICKEQKLLATGGSDYHGISKSGGITLGCSWTPEETFRVLYARSQENNPHLPHVL